MQLQQITCIDRDKQYQTNKSKKIIPAIHHKLYQAHQAFVALFHECKHNHLYASSNDSFYPEQRHRVRFVYRCPAFAKAHISRPCIPHRSNYYKHLDKIKNNNDKWRFHVLNLINQSITLWLEPFQLRISESTFYPPVESIIQAPFNKTKHVSQRNLV